MDTQDDAIFIRNFALVLVGLLVIAIGAFVLAKVVNSGAQKARQQAAVEYVVPAKTSFDRSFARGSNVISPLMGMRWGPLPTTPDCKCFARFFAASIMSLQSVSVAPSPRKKKGVAKAKICSASHFQVPARTAGTTAQSECNAADERRDSMFMNCVDNKIGATSRRRPRPSSGRKSGPPTGRVRANGKTVDA